jgi:hypothetical protein
MYLSILDFSHPPPTLYCFVYQALGSMAARNFFPWHIRLIIAIIDPIATAIEKTSRFMKHMSQQSFNLFLDTFETTSHNLVEGRHEYLCIIRAEKPLRFKLMRLPPEIREQIWIFASNVGRVVEIQHFHNRKRRFSSKSCIPGVLSTCQESRIIAMRFYKLAFRETSISYPDPDNSDITHQTNYQGGIWVNFAHDTIYFLAGSGILDSRGFLVRNYPRKHQDRSLERIQNMALLAEIFKSMMILGFDAYPELKELVLVVRDWRERKFVRGRTPTLVKSEVDDKRFWDPEPEDFTTSTYPLRQRRRTRAWLLERNVKVMKGKRGVVIDGLTDSGGVDDEM